MDTLETLQNGTDEKIELLSITLSKKLVGEPFLSKQGRELREVKIPNEDPMDKSPWKSFVVGANQVHLDRYSNGQKNYISLPADGYVTVKQQIESGVDALGKKTYDEHMFQVSTRELKEHFGRLRDRFFISKASERLEGGAEPEPMKESVTEKISKNQEKLADRDADHDNKAARTKPKKQENSI